jgi:DNA polymerase-3 subunit beta
MSATIKKSAPKKPVTAKRQPAKPAKPSKPAAAAKPKASAAKSKASKPNPPQPTYERFSVICDSEAVFDAVHALRPLVKTSLLPGSRTEYVVISADGGNTMELRASDMQTSARITCGQVAIQKGGAVAAPLAVLHDALSHAKASPAVTLREDKKERLSVNTDGSRVELRCLSVDEAPPFPKLKVAKRITIQAAALAAAIRETKYAVARESSRYAINGILIDHDGKTASFVATDGRRLVVSRKPAAGDKLAAIIPIAAAKVIEKYSADREGNVVIEFDAECKAFAVDASSWQVHAAVVEGVFPPYVDVIPKEADAKVRARVKPSDLVEAVEHAAVVREQDAAVKVEFTAGGLRVQAAGEPGESNVQTCPIADLKGEPMVIGFNPDYLCDIGRAIEGDELNIALIAPSKPALAWIGRSIHVLMPVTLK